mmetsp:Transcript_30752/g.46438  ORF Transcript_30752/g.46438 Transcript_30752/m.46438 type:complete len:184 (-) Transcript_30752:146-697(-)|eukprot:CAMPEP_0194764818 /NCGR_PEP_ID=MMETSP0323_2-20130528/23819_1 /TAXON_ID=2866 ORGANISM="Crypthecodinium cohnii, Strain Seligo" /NCGR_SAMPLE_ID=MMETSP0323_2 /ASSEMBLY_ACC=CAM_ASM_000346 /LENGTH=183 /DNA_ID=CAMNT_0039692831 /DNA_START=105 /DNA_END=656 /DNA_ORIENTATION=+
MKLSFNSGLFLLGLLAASLAPAGATTARASLRAVAAEKARNAGEFLGENRAAEGFFKGMLGHLPKNLTKEKQDAVVASLEAEVNRLNGNVLKLKDIEQQQAKSSGASEDHLKSTLKGKDKEMLENMDAWSHRMNEKAKVGAVGVMSKLKNAIHLIKKGALSGNQDAEAKLSDVLEHMSAMAAR